MRFCDFFTEYKLLLKDEKNTIKWKELPLYRKISLVVLFICAIVGIVLLVLFDKKESVLLLIISIVTLVVVVMVIIDSKKEHMRYMLENHYKKYSENHMERVVDLLSRYHITVDDDTAIDRLISQAESDLLNNNPIQQFKTPIKIFSVSILPIAIYTVKRVSEDFDIASLVYYASGICVAIIGIVAIVYALYPLIRWIIYNDYEKYNSLIYDLKQIQIFGIMT